MQAKRLGEKVFSKFEAQHKRIVVIGDRISQDIIPAKKVGLETIWIPGPYYPGIYSMGKPDYQVKKISELREIL